MIPHEVRSDQIGIGSTFFVHAFVSGSWGPRIPEIKADLQLDAGALGVALMGLGIGLILGTRLAGRLVQRPGTRLPIRLGLPLHCAALVGLSLAPAVVALTGAFVVLGLTSGFLDVAMNANAVTVERGGRRPIMSRVHGIWSLGLLAGSGLGAGAAAAGASVMLHFGVVAFALAVLAAVATRGSLGEAPNDLPGESASPTLRRKGLPCSPELLLGTIAFSSFAGEGSAADWSAVYMHETIGTGTGRAGIAFIAFSLGMVASRFAGDALSARFGPTLVTRCGGLLAAGGLAASVGAPSTATAVAGYLLFGVGLGPIVPITFSAAGNADQTRAAPLLGSVVGMGYVGSVVGPVVIGFTADTLGLRFALIVPAVLALTAAALAFSVATAAGGRGSARRPR